MTRSSSTHVHLSARRQTGAVLAITLILLFIAGFIGLYMLAGTTQDLRVARNTQEGVVSFERTQAAVDSVLRASAISTDNANDPLRTIDARTLNAAELAPDNSYLANVQVNINLRAANVNCPFMDAQQAFDQSSVQCNFYDIQATDQHPTVRTEVHQGIARFVLNVPN